MFTADLKAHERKLLEEYFPPELGELIISLLGFNRELRRDSFAHFDTHDRIKVSGSIGKKLEIRDLMRLPGLSLNYTHKEIEGVWQVIGDELRISEFDGHSTKLEKAIDSILPYDSGDSEIIPITIFIPKVDKSRSGSLNNHSTSWDFYNLQYESDSDTQGFGDLSRNPESYFGLRLFLALKLMGLANINQSAKNNSKFFLHLINSTELDAHFKRIDTSRLKEHQKLSKQLLKMESMNKKTSDNSKLKEIQSNIYNLSERINNLSLGFEGGRRKAGFYYTLDRKPGYKHQLDDEELIYPTLNSKIKPKSRYKDNRIELDGNVPTPRHLRRMRFALSYLISMTSGTAVTFNIKSQNYKEIMGPVLLLPETWNEFALALKQHNPRNEVGVYDESVSESDFREQCKSAVYMDFWYKRKKFMRLIPGISHTSDQDIDHEQRIKLGNIG